MDEPTKGKGWHGDIEAHAEAGRKGGRKLAENREHMAEIGRRGGTVTSANREHMAAIGSLGGKLGGRGRNQDNSPTPSVDTPENGTEAV